MDEAEAKRRKDILTALAEYQSSGELDVDAPALDRMLAEESDRSVVIILVSFVEDALFERICSELPKGDDHRRSLVKGGPLRNFEQRLVLARALGILSDREAGVLDVLRAMRNACAHSRRDISFGTAELGDAVTLMFLPPFAERLRSEEARKLRGTFILCAIFMLNLLRGRDLDESRRIMDEVINEMAPTGQERVLAHEVMLATLRRKQTDKPTPDLRRPAKDKARSRQRRSSPE